MPARLEFYLRGHLVGGAMLRNPRQTARGLFYPDNYVCTVPSSGFVTVRLVIPGQIDAPLMLNGNAGLSVASSDTLNITSVSAEFDPA